MSRGYDPLCDPDPHVRENAFNDTMREPPPPVPLPSLDPDETSLTDASNADVDFRHTWWQNDRRRVRAAIKTAWPGSNRLVRFATCGDAAWVFESVKSPGRYKVCSQTCRDRWCRSCQRDRSRIIAGNLRNRIKDQPCRLVTFTLRHRSHPLKVIVDRLFDCFRAMRRRPIWKNAVRGGVAFLEIKLSKRTGEWHPHLHVIVDSDYMKQSHLSGAWAAVTGDSHVVDIRLIRDAGEVARYVAKYASKPVETKLYKDPRRLAESLLALHGRRLVFTFGTFRGWKLTEQGDTGEWINLGALAVIRRDAAQGDADAAALLARLVTDPSIVHEHGPDP